MSARTLLPEALNKQIRSYLMRICCVWLMHRHPGEITRNARAHMYWKSPDQVEVKYGVRIVGWPSDVPFKGMAKSSVSQATKLYGLVTRGTLRIEKIETAVDAQ